MNGSSSDRDSLSWESELRLGPDLRTSTLSIIVISLWATRFAHDRRSSYIDARGVFVAFCILNRKALISYVGGLVLQWPVPRMIVSWTCAFLCGIWFVSRTPRSKVPWPDISHKQLETAFLKPCMFPCRTTHSRLFPTKHSFSYSYLYAGIPVGWKGAAGTILSAESDTTKTWFSVVAKDYLERGTQQDGLVGKLREYLVSQGVLPERFPYAYLVTAPRFLGFSFNPVSFWYLYNGRKSLAAMILEVNNTFDERRMYYMERREDTNESKDLGVKFAQEWPKDFHVSPFNDRGGTYSVQSMDPFYASLEGMHRVDIDNNIVLKSEDGKTKLIARVFSTEPAMDATLMSTWRTIAFVTHWWWVGFMTNPRILKEARTLWVKKLQVYYRPEVLSSSIGRNETPDEAALEFCFRSYLQWTADTTGISFRYKPGAGPSRAKLLTLVAQESENGPKPESEIEIRILTPAFYSQLVRYATFREALDKHCFQAKDGEAMVQCTQPEGLYRRLTEVSALLQDSAQPSMAWAVLDNFRKHSIFTALWTSLRAAPSTRHINASDFDTYMRSSSAQPLRQLYYRIVLKLLLADRVAFGWTPVLKLEETLVWSLLIFAAASAIGGVSEAENLLGRATLFTMVKVCGLHIWSTLL